jgi:hypothetical protein
MSSASRRHEERPVEQEDDAASAGTDEASRLLTGAAKHTESRSAPGAAGIVTAEIAGADPDGRPRVVWPGGPPAGAAAQTVWMERPPDWADCKGLRVAVGFEEGDQTRPVVLGLRDRPPQGKPRTLRIESGEELTLECGESKIVLRADGSITILGVKVVSRARGVNKIRGGSVQIN